MSSSVALTCSSRERAHTCVDARTRALVTSSTRSGAATSASDRHSSAASIVRHGVSVPPQSKMTASTATNSARDLVGGRLGGDLSPLVGSPVAQLDDAVGETLAHHDDRRHAEQLGVLELDARGHLL